MQVFNLKPAFLLVCDVNWSDDWPSPPLCCRLTASRRVCGRHISQVYISTHTSVFGGDDSEKATVSG